MQDAYCCCVGLVGLFLIFLVLFLVRLLNFFALDAYKSCTTSPGAKLRLCGRQGRIYNGKNDTSVPGQPLRMRIRGLPFLNLRGQPFLQHEVMGKKCQYELNELLLTTVNRTRITRRRERMQFERTQISVCTPPRS